MSEPSAAIPDSELLSSLKLSLVSGLGPRLYRQLLERFGTAEAVLLASHEELIQTPGVGRSFASLIRQARDKGAAEQELRLCAQHGVRIIRQQDDEYPRLLREIADPPPLLYVKGKLEPRDNLAIAIVGARRASVYGTQQATRLAGSLAQMGFTIVSGLARGTDAAAHRGAITVGGRTVAVLAGGLARIYPPEHEELAQEVTRSGALISEAPMRYEPLAELFPRRNRLISGMSLGVVVVEASTRSGALITARHAAEQGREVFAVPGRIDNPLSHGSHRLIKEGARLLQSPEDILEELGPLVETTMGPSEQPIRHPAELILNETERRLMELIPTEPTPVDGIISQSGLPPAQVISMLSLLEMRHLVRRLAGNYYCRV